MFITFKDGYTIHFVKNVNDGKNNIYFVKDGRVWGTIPNVNKDWGNYWFKLSKNVKLNDGLGEDVYNQIFLDSYAFDNDYDCYSDFYKEIYNVRPHYTIKEWEDIVKYVRNRKP